MVEVFNRDRQRVAILENAYSVEEDRRINAIWYLSFSLPYNDPKNEYCKPFFYVRVGGGELYRIMPSSTEINETGGVEYEAEHVLATLLDNVLFGFHVVGNRGVYTEECIQYVLDHQLERHWVLDRCEFRRQFEYGWEQETLLSALFSIATPLSGYMWKTDTTSYPWRLSLLNIGAQAVPQLYVRSAWNMLEYQEERDPQQVCTRLYPLGYGEGVNQLGIADINDGLPYLQSPPEIVERYGIVERIWIDRRYEDVESLKAAAQAMLDELQEPLRQFKVGFTELDSSDYNRAEVGRKVRIIHPQTGEFIDTTITGLNINHDDVVESSIKVANRSTSIASSVADMADRQRIEQAYSQGATQLYAQSLQANCDSMIGARMDFYIPAEMRIINSIAVKVRMSPFRAYSQATEAQATNVYSSSSQPGTTSTSSAGGGTVSSTAAGGGSTSGATSIESSNVLPNETTGQAVHNHGLAANTRLAVVDDNGDITGYVRWVPSGAHVHPEHTHSLPEHSHSFTTFDHSHSVQIPGHAHTLEVPGHRHDIVPGIYTFGWPKTFRVVVNGKQRAAFSTADAEIELTEYLVNEDTKTIPRGSWMSIEIVPDDLAYISMNMYVQGFVQSRGDRTL